jgi:GalNAc-alpha-(1->4)-GalNAc-alpha-(1->3)-diNAcBac-PP-undecaprenol alpha-1,4-N-acetyl-D-galactosaminyltransferase
MRLVFVIAGLGGGGSERVISVLANACADGGHDVSVVTLDPATVDFYTLRPAIERVRLDIEPSSTNALHRMWLELQLLRALRAELRRRAPDAVISFSTETNARVLLATVGLGLNVVVSERSDPAKIPMGRAWPLLRRLLYRRADAVVMQTEEARRWVDVHTSAQRTLVIPNPLAQMSSGAGDVPVLPQPLVVAMGRLRPEKGFDMLLEAFAQTRTAHPEWHLAIIGDGPERSALEHRAGECSIRNAVTFVGQLAHPADALVQGQLFVLPSRFEGFPNALIEAMSLGLPVVSFDSPSGPRAIVSHGVDGVLVPAEDVQALAVQLSRLMGDPAMRARLGSAARSVTSRFAPDRVVNQWLAAIRPAVSGATAVVNSPC